MATTEQTHVPVHEAKAKFSEMIRRAEQGEEIIITSHGTPVAKIVPATPPKVSGEDSVNLILELRKTLKGRATRDEIVEWIHEGRRY
jgi:prevent-host-death family protein